ncbi:MAG: AsmA family protein [Propionivibrio sp.]
MKRRTTLILAGLLVFPLAALLIGELMAWRFAAGPAERMLGNALGRPLAFGPAHDEERFELHLLGGIRLRARDLSVANPDPHSQPPMVRAQALELYLRYRDLLDFKRGDTLRIAGLKADALDLHLLRARDGTASWRFGNPGAGSAAPALIDGIVPQRLEVRDGRLSLQDDPQQLELQGTFRYLPERGEAPGAADSGRLEANAHGHFRGAPLKALVSADKVPALLGPRARDVALPVRIDATLGKAELQWSGALSGLGGEDVTLDGNYRVKGSSLAVAGDALGITLPATAAFAMEGHLRHAGADWETRIEHATIGRSKLTGQFHFMPAQGSRRAFLRGTLNGRVLLQDLGPAIGTDGGNANARRTGSPRVLPDRKFDLPSLRAMDADVLIALERLDLGDSKLEPLTPLNTHLLLREGLLQLQDLDARMASGQVSGNLSLDGRQTPALWQAQLALHGAVLEKWVEQARAAGQPPYLAGLLGGSITLRGSGQSTAEILGNADGQMRLLLTQGRLSHLVVEAAGVDLAQALGVALAGDDALEVNCGVAAFEVRQGVVHPEFFVLDTQDSTLLVDGSLSLRSERLALRVRVSPKDVSPFSVRTPLEINGRFAAPELRLQTRPVLARAVSALALSVLHPLASLLPFVDPGDDSSREAIAVCGKLLGNQTKQPTPVGRG